MATKQFYATGAFKYGTRMMQAGDPVQMDAPTARLYRALKKISDQPVGVRRTTTAPAAPATTTKPQLDHDGDSKAGGSLKGARSTRAKGAARKRATKK